MVKCYKTKNLDSYYLEMWATEWFLKWEIKTLVDKLREKEEEIKKLKAENEYRHKIVDIVPQDEKSIAEETIKDLLKEIKRLKEENKRLSDFLECES